MPEDEDKIAELKQDAEKISAAIKINGQRMDAVAKKIDSLRVLEHLQCDGNTPDLSKLTDEQISQLYDLGVSNRGLNNLPDNHPHSLQAIKDRAEVKPPKPPPPPLSRQQMEEGITSMLQSRDNKITPVQIAAAQVETAEGLSRDMGGKYDASNQDIMNLQEKASAMGVPFDASGIKGELNSYKGQLQSFERGSQDLVSSMASRPGRLALEKLKNKPDHTPQDVQACIDENKKAMGARQLDLRGMDMSGLKIEGVRFKGCAVNEKLAPKQLEDIQADLLAEMDAVANPLKGLARLEKLLPVNGQPPNLEALDRADLEAAYKHLLQSPYHPINLLENDHPFSKDNLQGVSVSQFSDQQLREGLSELLQKRNAKNEPLNAARILRVMNAEVKESLNHFRENIVDIQREYDNLVKAYPELKDAVVDENLVAQSAAVKEYAAIHADQILLDAGGRHLRRELERLGPDASPEQVSACFQSVTQIISLDGVKRDGSGIPPGTDLSQTDLKPFSVDSVTLSRCRGLDSVRGVNPRVLAEAQAIQPHVARLDDLNRRMAKLENKGGVLDNLRNLRHGGVDGERKHLQKEMEKAHQEIAKEKAFAAEIANDAVQNEFEQRQTYSEDGELVIAKETEESLRAKKSQASETYKAKSDKALDDRGTKSAVGKRGLGQKTAELQEKAASIKQQPAPDPQDKEAVAQRKLEIKAAEHDVGQSAFKDVGLLHFMSALYGKENDVIDAEGDDMVLSSKAKQEALGADPSSLLSRAVATSTLNKSLGMDAVAEEKFAVDDQNRASSLSVVVPGAAILTRPTEGNPQENFLDVDYANPQIQKGLFDLEAQDYIAGQIDRHTGNIFVDPHNNEVRGIDNDMAFPVIPREQMMGSADVKAKAVPDMPMFMHEDTAKKIEALDPEQLRADLESIKPPEGVAALEPEAIDGAVERLKKLQNHIKVMRQEGRVVSEFNKQTYEQAQQAQQASIEKFGGSSGIVPPASYLGAAIADKQKTLQMSQDLPKEQQRNIVKAKDVPKFEVDPQFAAYQNAVQDAKAARLANPNLVDDAALAKQIREGRANLAALEQELQVNDRNVVAAEARLRDAQHNGESERADGLADIFDHAQKERQKVLQAMKAEQGKLNAALNQAVNPLKNDIAAKVKQDALKMQEAAKVEVAPKVEEVEKIEIEKEAQEFKLEELMETKLELSVETPLTESEIAEIEANFADNFSTQSPINLEDSDYEQNESVSGIKMVEIPNEIEEYEQNLDQDLLEQPLNEAPGIEAPGQQAEKQPGVSSVRDALKGAILRKGSEQKLSEVAPDKVEIYKSLQAAVKELERMDGSNTIDAAVGDADAWKQHKEGATAQTIDRMKEEMAQMRAQDPGLKQLDRSKVGQAIHSGVRDAAKTVANKLK